MPPCPIGFFQCKFIQWFKLVSKHEKKIISSPFIDLVLFSDNLSLNNDTGKVWEYTFKKWNKLGFYLDTC